MRYVLAASASVILKAIQMALGWLFIAPFIWVRMDGNYPSFIRAWFQPTDSPAIGDDAYGNKEALFTAAYPRWVGYYIRAVMWGCRNPAYGWDALRGFTIQDNNLHAIYGDPNVDIGLQATFGITKRYVCQNDITYFDYKRAGNYGNGYGWMVRFGWCINSFNAGYHANLVIDIRPRIKLP